jgi:hypothetical protein
VFGHEKFAVRLIRFRGHLPKGEYDVHDGRDEAETNPTQFY